MFSIFRKKRQYQKLDWMQVDMHSHILPGLDDGAGHLDDSLQLLERLHALGLEKFYFTPHIFSEMYPNSPSDIAGAFLQVKRSSYATLAAGFSAEYMVDAAFDQMLRDQVTLAPLPGNRVLIEMSYMQESAFIEQAIFELQVQGYKPVLAHPERYLFYHGNPEKIKHLQHLGCHLQLNLLSLYGYYGRQEQKAARYLCEQGWIDFVGSDVHHMRHVKSLEHWMSKEDLWPYFKRCNLQNQSLFDSNIVSPYPIPVIASDRSALRGGTTHRHCEEV